ncbi:uncharacterized protein [Lolium perenne]|uniref:uncharacterized protein n=1 Tax=Lolium perenne TaxID=4522 RepID=UPI003A9927B1
MAEPKMIGMSTTTSARKRRTCSEPNAVLMKQSSLEDSRQSDPVQHYDNAGVMKKSLVEDRAQKRFRGEPMQRYNNAVVMKQSSSEERLTKSSDLSSDASSHSRQPRPFLSSINPMTLPAKN